MVKIKKEEFGVLGLNFKIKNSGLKIIGLWKLEDTSLPEYYFNSENLCFHEPTGSQFWNN